MIYHFFKFGIRSLFISNQFEVHRLVSDSMNTAITYNWGTFQILPSWVCSWCYQQMLRLDWKVIARYKHLAYMASSTVMKEKKFYEIDTSSPRFTSKSLI
jgi:hypothetical protein